MSGLSQFLPLLGAPTRVTRYHAGTTTSGTHTFVEGALWCRLTVVGGGGEGGDTGNWTSNGFDTNYEDGGGGGGGETRMVEFDPHHIVSAEYAVGAASTASRFHSFTAAAGANGANGLYETGGSYFFEGGLGGGLQRLGDNDINAERPTVPRGSYQFPGRTGGGKGDGTGGDSLYGTGGVAGAYSSDAPPTPLNNGSMGSGFGAGGGAGGRGPNQGTGGVRTGGTGANGTGGLIVVEEWVYTGSSGDGAAPPVPPPAPPPPESDEYWGTPWAVGSGPIGDT